MDFIQIAIDGPAGAGKSTIAKMIAEQLGFTYIDTGSMYRAITLKALINDIDLNDERNFKFIYDTKLEFYKNRLYMDGINISDRIRNNDVSNNVSVVASYLSVRLHMVDIQKEMSRHDNVVMDGRDIGYKVLPFAKFKFFLTASIEERAKRRHRDNISRGISSDRNTLQQEIARRDHIDTTREHSPLRPASDAIIIDTSHLTIEQVVETITLRIREVEIHGV